jgi:predicted transposase/invertase (TIGR01784 family)
MAKIVNHHDKFFRASMQNIEVARDFFRVNLPKKILKKIKLKTLKLAPSQFVHQRLKQSITDILYTVETTSGLGYLSLLIEHQKTAQKILPFRLLKI